MPSDNSGDTPPPTHTHPGPSGGGGGSSELRGRKGLVPETTLSVAPTLPSGRAPHLDDPYVEVPTAVNGWEARGDVHPRPGRSEGGNKNQSSQTLAARHLGSKEELLVKQAPSS